jgi:SAM-dependent methyltransferase
MMTRPDSQDTLVAGPAEAGQAREGVRFLTSASPIHSARLFEWEGGLYRAVRPEKAPLFQRLLDEGMLASLVEKELMVPTEKAALSLPGYPLVFKHARLPFVTYPFEWPAAALKEAGLLQARLNRALAPHGLTCVDAHPWNVLFDGAKPLFVDLGSIATLDEVNLDGLMDEFNAFHLFPLCLMQHQQHRIARCLLRDHTRVITRREFSYLEGADMAAALGRMARRLRRSLYKRMGRQPSLATLAKRSQTAWRHAEESLAAIHPKASKSLWSGYCKEFPPFDDLQTAKQQSVAAALRRLGPKTVLDLGANAGWYAQLAAHLGARVVASDVDEDCVEQSYLRAKEGGLSVSSIFLDVRVPTPSTGWSGTYYPSAMDRLGADCVLALALVHHLIFSQLADLDLVVDALCSFTRKDLIVEFIPREDEFVAKWWNELFGWYTLENFTVVLRGRFEKVQVLPSTPKCRSIVVCEGLKDGRARRSGQAGRVSVS